MKKTNQIKETEKLLKIKTKTQQTNKQISRKETGNTIMNTTDLRQKRNRKWVKTGKGELTK
jgi:hypothetical protein